MQDGCLGTVNDSGEFDNTGLWIHSRPVNYEWPSLLEIDQSMSDELPLRCLCLLIS